MVDLQSRAPWQPEDVTVPVVAGHGTRSQPHHTAGAQWLTEQIEGAELMVIEGASHGAHLSHPRAFAELVERTIERGRHSPASEVGPRQ